RLADARDELIALGGALVQRRIFVQAGPVDLVFRLAVAVRRLAHREVQFQVAFRNRPAGVEHDALAIARGDAPATVEFSAGDLTRTRVALREVDVEDDLALGHGARAHLAGAQPRAAEAGQ